MPKLTKRTVDSAAPNGRDYFVWDSEIPGFGLRVFASGRRSYVIQYKIDGRTRRMSLGAHGVLTPESARQKAKRLLVQVIDGQDPADTRKTERQGITVSDLCERYYKEHVLIHNKPNTAKECRRLINARIIPALGAIKITKLSRQDVIKLHQSMQGTPRQANLMLSVLSKALNLAEFWELREENSNPCRHIKKYPERARERFLSEHELSKLGTELSKSLEAGLEHKDVAYALRLLALSGCRLGEVASLKWDYVDLEHGLLLLPDAKTGARAHPIGDSAIALLSDITRKADSPWVFHAARTNKNLSTSTIEAAWRRIRDRIDIPDIRIHDLRHTVGTYSGQTGANAFLIRDKLGHSTLAMTSRYVNKATPSLRELSDQVESRISDALSRPTTA